MARITDLRELMFRVEERPVFAHLGSNKGNPYVRVPTRKAIVNATSGQILGIVGQNYRLLTNQEAIALGERCCEQFFENVEQKEWTVFKVFGPSTASFCYIDLMHKTFVLNFSDAQLPTEVYVPYVRVTNSYNASKALRFDVGFCRSLCSNGVIFEAETISFRFTHTKDSLISTGVTFDLQKGKLKKLQEDFGKYITALRNFFIDEEDCLSLINSVIGIPDRDQLELEPGTKEEKERDSLEKHLVGLIRDYRKEFAGSAYALFNAMTDLASNPPSNRFLRKDTNSMQRTVGAWLRDFSRQCGEKDFLIQPYIQELKGRRHRTGNGAQPQTLTE
jgi:hypothetical protein